MEFYIDNSCYGECESCSLKWKGQEVLKQLQWGRLVIWTEKDIKGERERKRPNLQMKETIL